jgi:hypothetical protein
MPPPAQPSPIPTHATSCNGPHALVALSTFQLALSPQPSPRRRGGGGIGTFHTVVRNGPLARPDTRGAHRTSNSNQSNTTTQKWPFYMTAPRTDRQYTSSHKSLRCDVFRSPTERPVMWLRCMKVEAFRKHNTKQLIRPMLDYACRVWRSAPCSHVRKLQVLQFKCLRIATNAPFTEVTSKFMRIWEFLSLPTTSDL